MKILFSLTFLSLFLGACTLGKDVPVNPPTNTPAPQQQNTVSYTQTLQKASSKIKDTKEFEDCMQPSVNMCITKVGNDLARAKKSPEFCSEMPDQNNKDACVYGVIVSQISPSSELSVCDGLSDVYKGSCRSTIITMRARESRDVTKCDALAPEKSSSGETDESIPPTRGESLLSQCYLSVIMQNENAQVADCEKIPTESDRKQCESILKSRPTERHTPPMMEEQQASSAN